MLVVVLGVAYAFVTVKSRAVEAMLLSVLVGSMGGAALFVIVKHHREGSRAPSSRPSIRQATANAPGAASNRQSGKRLSTVRERLTKSSSRSSNKSRLSFDDRTGESHREISGLREDSPACKLTRVGSSVGAMI